MSATLTVHGIIISPMGDPANNPWRHHEANREIINALSNDMPFPEIHRDMFGFATEDIRFRDECIHFGALYRQYEEEWPDWLTNFEALLAKLYWVEASVYVHLEMIGEYMYHYQAEDLLDTVLFTDKPTPPTIWTMKGGPRDALKATQVEFAENGELLKKYYNQNTWRSENGELKKL